MTYSFSQYTGSGSVGPYTVGFPYLAQSHVAVTVAGVVKTVGTHYTWPSSTTIQFTAGNAPTSGQLIDIRRASSPGARLVDFQDAAGLTEADLDLADNQLIYLAQESLDLNGSALSPDVADGLWDAESKRIKNVTNGVNAQDAVTMAQLASAAIAPTGTLAIANGGTGVTTASAARTAIGVSVVPPQGRLTLTSGSPVSGDVSGATTLYYTPYVGESVPLYDGTSFAPKVFSEVSQATTDATKSPAAVAASKVYDVFGWDDSGTFRVTRGPAWTNDTTRGYTLTRVGGMLLNTSAITNGPGALRGTWLGTIYSDASSQLNDRGTTSAASTPPKRHVWNAYNRVARELSRAPATASHNYTTATWRQSEADSGNQFDVVTGASEDAIHVFGFDTTQSTVGAAYGYTNIGVDSTTVPSGVMAASRTATAGDLQSVSCSYVGVVPVGRHYYAKLEQAQASGVLTWYTNSSNILAGMTGTWRA